jgi:hypothetical protein
MQQALLLGIVSLFIGCSSVTTTGDIVVNPNAPVGSTKTIIVTKVNPVVYSGETIILAKDKNDKETHYEVHHTDVSMIASVLAAVAGFVIGAS